MILETKIDGAKKEFTMITTECNHYVLMLETKCEASEVMYPEDQ